MQTKSFDYNSEESDQSTLSFYFTEDSRLSKYSEEDVFIMQEVNEIFYIDHSDIRNSVFRVSWVGFPGWYTSYTLQSLGMNNRSTFSIQVAHMIRQGLEDGVSQGPFKC